MKYTLRVNGRILGWFEVAVVMPLEVPYRVNNGLDGPVFEFDCQTARDTVIERAKAVFAAQLKADTVNARPSVAA